jgi:cholesterol oxidase
VTHDFIIIGSGFGGSVSALRLAEKGYRVLVIEKGRRFNPGDFAKDNRDLKKWMWRPALGLRGIFHMAFLRHVTVLHGVGVGGGSLTYAATLPTPKDNFFSAPTWSHLADWKNELTPHYDTALRMLGAATNPRETPGDCILREIAQEDGREEHFEPTRVALFFGEEGKHVPDPFFGGEGPERTGCTFCGACMTGCNVGAKNTLDRNYLYLAEKRGAEVLTEREVAAVKPRDDGGYKVEVRPAFGRGPVETFEAPNVIFSAGVMGTIPLLLAMKEKQECLPRLSERLGKMVRTNSEALIGVIAPDYDKDLQEGVAITSIFHTDDHSHIEPVRYGRGSDFFRFLSGPHAPGKWAIGRILLSFWRLIRTPRKWAKVYFMSRAKFAKKTQVLLFMRSIEGTINLELGRSWLTGFRRGLVSRVDNPEEAPEAFMEDATRLAERFAEKVDGVTSSLGIETVLGSPSTAHILGGACMGANPEQGVIDDKHRVFGYEGLYIIDGSTISANPGVNPSLTITALAERAMSHIPARNAATA